MAELTSKNKNRLLCKINARRHARRRCRTALIRQPRPGYGLGIQVKSLETLKVVASSLGSGPPRTGHFDAVSRRISSVTQVYKHKSAIRFKNVVQTKEVVPKRPYPKRRKVIKRHLRGRRWSQRTRATARASTTSAWHI